MSDIKNNVNFFEGFFRIAAFLDKKYQIDSVPALKRDLSKYFYPRLAEQRRYGIRNFLDYVVAMNALGLGVTVYYYIYVAGLLILGKNICDNIIRILKDLLGNTPRL